ncbi:hypothetical protein BDR04DRAFT_1119690 [Suillus decipiens]|nr:hypothetical protein BDR04DRAFT_1119690 [Suillus decipiens]
MSYFQRLAQQCCTECSKSYIFPWWQGVHAGTDSGHAQTQYNNLHWPTHAPTSLSAANHMSSHGGKEYMQEQIQDMLRLSTTTRTGQPMPQQAWPCIHHTNHMDPKLFTLLSHHTNHTNPKLFTLLSHHTDSKLFTLLLYHTDPKLFTLLLHHTDPKLFTLLLYHMNDTDPKLFILPLQSMIASCLLSPVAEWETLTKFALEEFKGHVQDKDRLLMMVIRVDAGPWPLHAHFVFGGVDHPPIWMAPPWIVRCLQELLQIFWFTWSMRQTECTHLQANHKAGWELASLSKANKICAVLTEDSKTFMFGAKRVIQLAVRIGSEIRVDMYLNPAIPSSNGDEPCSPCFTSTQLNLIHLASFFKSHLGWGSEKIHGYLQRKTKTSLFG